MRISPRAVRPPAVPARPARPHSPLRTWMRQLLIVSDPRSRRSLAAQELILVPSSLARATRCARAAARWSLRSFAVIIILLHRFGQPLQKPRPLLVDSNLLKISARVLTLRVFSASTLRPAPQAEDAAAGTPERHGSITRAGEAIAVPAGGRRRGEGRARRSLPHNIPTPRWRHAHTPRRRPSVSRACVPTAGTSSKPPTMLEGQVLARGSSV